MMVSACVQCAGRDHTNRTQKTPKQKEKTRLEVRHAESVRKLEDGVLAQREEGPVDRHTVDDACLCMYIYLCVCVLCVLVF